MNMANVKKADSPRPRGWTGLAVSLVGIGHVRNELPCQDASAVVVAPRAGVVVCDGAGSARLSHDGAKAAVAAFKRGLGLFEPWLEQCLDATEMPMEVADLYWRYVCEWMARVLEESKLELVRDRGGTEKDYDFTVAFAVMGKVRCGFFQVGDGMIVVGADGVFRTVFHPAKGMFANETKFLRVGTGEKGAFMCKLLPRDLVRHVAVTSDGPVKLLFDMKTLEPSALFGQFFGDLESGVLTRVNLCQFLTCGKWAEIGAEDDKSLALLSAVDVLGGEGGRTGP